MDQARRHRRASRHRSIRRGPGAFAGWTHAEFDSVILATGYEPDIDTLLGSYRVAQDANGMPAELAASGELAGVFFVGFDNKQPGGLLRTIGLQARQVADLVSRP